MRSCANFCASPRDFWSLHWTGTVPKPYALRRNSLYLLAHAAAELSMVPSNEALKYAVGPLPSNATQTAYGVGLGAIARPAGSTETTRGRETSCFGPTVPALAADGAGATAPLAGLRVAATEGDIEGAVGMAADGLYVQSVSTTS